MLTNIKRIMEESIPTGVRSKFQSLINFAGEEDRAESWLVKNFTFSILFAIGVMTLPLIFNQYIPEFTRSRLLLLMFIISIITMVVFWVVILSSLFFKIEYRKRRTLEVLPDFLSTVAMNIHAGMEPVSALYISLRSDFEPITSEMKRTRSLAIGSKSILDQLSLLTTRIDSEHLRRTISIIDRASKSGGELGRLLLSVANDLSESSKVQKELETATRGYVYFISFLVLIGVPLLLSVSSIFIQTSAQQAKEFAGGLGTLSGFATGIPLSPGEQTRIDPESVLFIFIILLAVSSLSASLMLGVLWHGETKQGLRYLAILLPVSLAAFFVFRNLISGLLSIFGI